MVEFTIQELQILQELTICRIRKIKKQIRYYSLDNEIKNLFLEDYKEAIKINKKLEEALEMRCKDEKQKTSLFVYQTK